jgi:death-on-curing protein
VPTRHLTLLDVLALHEPAMAQSGALPFPLRDEGALDSAVARAQMVEDYEAADLFRQAATLITGISQAQAFVDGNKRTALYCGALFLSINGYELNDPQLVAELIIELAQHTMPREAADSTIAQHLRETCAPVTS